MVLVDSGCLENGDQDLIFIRANTASNSDIQRTCLMLQANVELKSKEIRKKKNISRKNADRKNNKNKDLYENNTSVQNFPVPQLKVG